MFSRINFYRMVAVTFFSLVTANAYSQLHIIHVDENGNATEEHGSSTRELNKMSPSEAPQLSTQESASPSASKEPSAAHPNPEHQKLDFAEGWLVKMYPAPEDLETIPYTEIASFVSKKSPYTLLDHRKTRELEFYKEPTAYLYEGYFNAEQAGDYNFIVNVIVPAAGGKKKCKYAFWIDDQKIIVSENLWSGYKGDGDFTLNKSTKMQPGYYKVKQWIACDEYTPTEISLRIKRPDVSLPTLAKPSDFYHEVKE